MVRGRSKIANSESEDCESEGKSSEEEISPKQKKQGISEYEKQRLSRIAENRARMEALGLSKMASSFIGSLRNSSRSSSSLKEKSKVIDEDEDYRPNDEDDHEDDDDDEEEEEEEEEEDFMEKKTPQSRKNKGKSKGSKSKRKTPVQKHLSSSDYVDDDDELMKAIALSLQDSGEVSGAVHKDLQDAAFTERKENARSKRKKSFNSRVKMSEDEMVAHFFQFDEAGKGGISVRDLQRIAIAHDFMWTDKELSDMIHCFDGDGDGKLNLEDFRDIVCRCNMLQTSENS